MKKKITRIIFFQLMVLLVYRGASGLGIGLSASSGAGLSSFNMNPAEDSGVDYYTGFGLVLDTAVAKNDRVSYRMHVGYESVVDPGVKFFQPLSVHKVSLSNIFGFKIFSNKYIRLWMGPQIALAYQFKSIKGMNKWTVFGPNNFWLENKTYKMRMGLLTWGGVFGLNINPGSLFTISLELGTHLGMGVGTYTKDVKTIGYTGGFIIPVYDMDNPLKKDCELGKIESFARICFIFRIKDVYEPELIETVDMKLK